MESYLFESSIALETTYDSSAGRERREKEMERGNKFQSVESISNPSVNYWNESYKWYSILDAGSEHRTEIDQNEVLARCLYMPYGPSKRQ